MTAQALTFGNDAISFPTAELTINFQSGSDFSVAADAFSNGTIKSAAGGQFMGEYWASAITAATLDGGSTGPRYVTIGGNMGPNDNTDPNYQAGVFGFDAVLPVLVGVHNAGNWLDSKSFGPSYVKPGQEVLYGLFSTLIGGFGTDSIPVTGLGVSGVLWQV